MHAPQFGIVGFKKSNVSAPDKGDKKPLEIHTHRKVDMFLQLAADGKDSSSLRVFAEANGIGHVGVEKKKKEKHLRHEQNLAMRAAAQSAAAKKHDKSGGNSRDKKKK